MQKCTFCSKTGEKDPTNYQSDDNWGTILDKNHFQDRTMTVYEILNYDFENQTEEHICNDCIDKVQLEPYLPVECDRCHKKFRSTFPYNEDKQFNSNQGIDCDSTVTDDIIVGAYGSNFDNVRVTYANGRPDELEKSWNICDGCIEELIVTGVCEDKYETTKCPDCHKESKYYNDRVELDQVNHDIIETQCYDCFWSNFKEGMFKCTKCKKEWKDYGFRESVSSESEIVEIICQKCEWETSSEENE